MEESSFRRGDAHVKKLDFVSKTTGRRFNCQRMMTTRWQVLLSTFKQQRRYSS